MISAIQGLQLTNQKVNQTDSSKLTGNESFTYALDAAKNLISANVSSEQEVNNMTVDFLTGKNDDIASLLIAQEKSSILLQYSLQVRNGVLSAYKEIMSLSV